MRYFCVICLLLSATISLAEERKKVENLPILMRDFFATLMEMKPYMVSYEEFKDPKNQKRVKTLIDKLESKVETTQAPTLNSPGFQLTYDLFAKHLRDTSYLYEKEIYDTAWDHFRASTQFCIACHERLSKGVGQFEWSSSKLDSRGALSDISEADFLYIGHQFPAAIQIYDSIIRNYNPDLANGTPKQNLEGAYSRKISYFARVLRNPDVAIKSLKEDLRNKQLRISDKKNIQSWILQFEDWKKEKVQNFSKMSDSSLLNYALPIVESNTGNRRITISDPSAVPLLKVSGLLYERVFTQPKSPKTQELLYLLARCERDLAPISNYSLADVYLKECILLNPKNPVAKKCFSDYELSLKQRFHSGATPYFESALESLRKMIQ